MDAWKAGFLWRSCLVERTLCTWNGIYNKNQMGGPVKTKDRTWRSIVTAKQGQRWAPKKSSGEGGRGDRACGGQCGEASRSEGEWPLTRPRRRLTNRILWQSFRSGQKIDEERERAWTPEALQWAIKKGCWSRTAWAPSLRNRECSQGQESHRAGGPSPGRRLRQRGRVSVIFKTSVQ